MECMESTVETALNSKSLFRKDAEFENELKSLSERKRRTLLRHMKNLKIGNNILSIDYWLIET